MQITINLEDASMAHLALIQRVLRLDQPTALSWAIDYSAAQAATLALALRQDEEQEEER